MSANVNFAIKGNKLSLTAKLLVPYSIPVTEQALHFHFFFRESMLREIFMSVKKINNNHHSVVLCHAVYYMTESSTRVIVTQKNHRLISKSGFASLILSNVRRRNRKSSLISDVWPLESEVIAVIQREWSSSY